MPLSTHCPACRAALDDVTYCGPGEPTPQPGDASICLYCSAILIFTDDLSLRLATTAERHEIEGLKSYKAADIASRATRQTLGRRSRPRVN